MTPTDAELNEKVAAIAGWKPTRGDLEYCAAWERTSGEKLDPFKLWPSYATDLNAVVAVLQKATAFCTLEFISGDQWTCTLTYASPKPEGLEAFEATGTLARAICLALWAARADAARKEQK
jgi:hypothetical protein